MNQTDFENLLVENNIDIVRKIYNRSFRARDDDDLIQSGMIGLWEAAKSWDGSGKFESYAAVCVRNNMLDYIRAQRNPPAQLDDWMIHGQWIDRDRIDDQELERRIRTAWPPGSIERHILLSLSFGEDRKSIAGRLGIEAYQIKKIAKRAIKKIK